MISFCIYKTTEILLWTDFADYASSEKARSIFFVLIKNKFDYLSSSRVEVQAKYEATIKHLRVLLATEYVAQSNIGEITSIDSLQFSIAPDRTKVIKVPREIIEVINDGIECCQTHTRRKTVFDDQTVADDSFNLSRDAMRASIQSNITEALAYAHSLSEVCAAMNLIQWSMDSFEHSAIPTNEFITVDPGEAEKEKIPTAPADPFLLKRGGCYSP